jgi:hypothetical protein
MPPGSTARVLHSVIWALLVLGSSLMAHDEVRVTGTISQAAPDGSRITVVSTADGRRIETDLVIEHNTSVFREDGTAVARTQLKVGARVTVLMVVGEDPDDVEVTDVIILSSASATETQ